MSNPSLAENVSRGRHLLDERAAADYLGLRPGTLANWRCTGSWSLPFVKVGGRVRYRQDDLDAWLAARTHLNRQQSGSKA